MRFKLWFDRAFELARNITDFAVSTRANKKRTLEKQLAGLLTTATGCSLVQPRPEIAGQSRQGAGPASDLLRLSRRSGPDQQRLGTKTPPQRDPAKGHQRLSGDVGRRSRGGRSHDHRHRKAEGRIPFPDHPRYARRKRRAWIRGSAAIATVSSSFVAESATPRVATRRPSDAPRLNLMRAPQPNDVAASTPHPTKSARRMRSTNPNWGEPSDKGG
jgi:hypothetical protein